MKKLFLLLALLMPMMASAYDAQIGGIYYNLITNDNVAEVTYESTSYNSYSGSVAIPATVTYDGVTYSVTSIGNSAFRGSSGLTSVEIPNSITSIGDEAFNKCSSLTSVNIPNSVTSLGNEAFYKCSGLTSVNIPNNVTSIGEETFRECSSLTSITIPNSVTSIGKNAFRGCSSLTSFTIPNSVTSLGEGVFRVCSGLTSVNIPSSVTSIGKNTFYNCSGLTSITIPNSVTSIGDDAFLGCSSMTSVTIGSGVKSVGSIAFQKCAKLTDVYCYAENVPATGSDAFEDTNIANATLHVPEASVSAYQSTEPWSGFGNIVSIGEEPVTRDIVINETNFPDGIFRNWILSKSYGSDGILTDVEIASVTNIDVSGKGIQDLKGIEYFTALKNLSCYLCELTSLDVSKNTALTYLSCGANKLTSLDLSNNTSLTTLYCYCNQIAGESMDALVASLPTVSYGSMGVLYKENERNVMTTIQVAAAKAKGWKPLYHRGIKWEEYAGSEPAPLEKCATPTISYVGGKLTFSCETEGVEFVSEITCSDAKKNLDPEVTLSTIYNVSVYATKSGYEDSDIATKEINVGDSGSSIRGDVNGDGDVNVGDLVTVSNIMAGN